MSLSCHENEAEVAGGLPIPSIEVFRNLTIRPLRTRERATPAEVCRLDVHYRQFVGLEVLQVVRVHNRHFDNRGRPLQERIQQADERTSFLGVANDFLNAMSTIGLIPIAFFIEPTPFLRLPHQNQWVKLDEEVI